MANRANAGAGGSGAGYHAKVVITDPGIYTITIGSGGVGYGGPKGVTRAGGNGTDTTFKNSSNVTLISAGGGYGGYARGDAGGASGGAGGTLTKNIQEDTVYVSSNGSAGGSITSAGSVGGAASPIGGHTWGASGSCSGNYNGGSASSSYHGYFSIKYIGP